MFGSSVGSKSARSLVVVRCRAAGRSVDAFGDVAAHGFSSRPRKPGCWDLKRVRIPCFLSLTAVLRLC